MSSISRGSRAEATVGARGRREGAGVGALYVAALYAAGAGATKTGLTVIFFSRRLINQMRATENW